MDESLPLQDWQVVVMAFRARISRSEEVEKIELWSNVDETTTV